MRPALIMLAAVTALALAACGRTTSITGTARGPASAPPSAPASAPPPSAGSPPASSPDLSGLPGTTFTVSGQNGPNGQDATYEVTMTRVVQHAVLGQDETVTTSGDHVAAARFTITGDSGQASDDANNDAVAVGSDGQDYTPAFDRIAEGTNFNGGDFNVSPGRQVIGWVVFELPPGVSVAQVQWSPGLGGQVATWDVSS
jgi:hypothetical protein